MSTGPPKCSVCLNHIILGPGELIYTCMTNGGCAEGVYCELCVNHPQFTKCAICRGPKKDISINRHATLHIDENASLKCADCDEAVLWKDAFSHEKAHMMDRVKEDGSAILKMRKIYQNEREIVLLAVAQNGMVLKDLSEEMKNDEDIILKALANNGLVLSLLPPLVQENEMYALAAVRDNWRAIENLRLCHSTNPKVILEGVKGHPVALSFAAMSLKKNIDFVLCAVMRDPQAIRYAHVSMKTNRDVFRTAILQDKGGTIFRDLATDALKKDRKIVLAAVEQCGTALQFADSCFLKDPEVLCRAASNDVRSLQFANQEFMVKLLREQQNREASSPNHKRKKPRRAAPLSPENWLTYRSSQMRFSPPKPYPSIS